MIIHEYQCKNCKKVVDIEIKTSDITTKYGIVNEEFNNRIAEAREKNKICECGGQMRRLYTTVPAMFFEHPLQGKLSRRYL